MTRRCFTHYLSTVPYVIDRLPKDLVQRLATHERVLAIVEDPKRKIMPELFYYLLFCHVLSSSVSHLQKCASDYWKNICIRRIVERFFSWVLWLRGEGLGLGTDLSSLGSLEPPCRTSLGGRLKFTGGQLEYMGRHCSVSLIAYSGWETNSL